VICSTAGRGTGPTNTGYSPIRAPEAARLRYTLPVVSRWTMSPTRKTTAW
jgi:hypothetical protein